jgi:2-C-methyl-D-erythritol 4-phosphate cytidylyltransferase
MGAAAGGVRKQYLEVLGEPVLRRAVRAFVEHPRVEAVVVVLPAEDVASPPEWLRDLPVRLVAGGAERGDSVWNGLQAVPDSIEVVLVHDGARPFVSAAVIDRVIEAGREGGAIAAVRVTDTIKEADEDGVVRATPDRARLWQAQTPQGFPLRTLREAYGAARAEGWSATDDAALCERIGVAVRVVEGAAENLKITRPADLLVAEALARGLRHP